MPFAGAEAPTDDQYVFLNVPFDKEYTSLFLALIAGLAGLGLTPRCVLEVPSGGRSRLERIFGLISSCSASIHDLSRVTLRVPLKFLDSTCLLSLGSAMPCLK
jgi:hypothetical protein